MAEQPEDGGPAADATLRDLFAMAALQGMIACPNTRGDIPLEPIAYKVADRMLKARQT